MNHEQIEQLDLIDRYLMGQLPAEVSSGFEEHFVDCPQCIARLQTTKIFLRDLRLAAAEQSAQIGPHPPTNLFRQFLKSLFVKPLSWAAVSLLIAAAIGAVFVFDYTRRLREEVNQAKTHSEQWQRRYEDERQSAMVSDRIRSEAEAQQAEQLRALEAKLKQQEAQGSKTEPGRRSSPEGNLPIFVLTSLRRGEPIPAEGDNQIKLPNSATIFAFSIPLEGETRYETYRIRILDDQGELKREIRNLPPVRQGALYVWFNKDSFRPGRYSLIVEGNKKDGRDQVGIYPFLIVKVP